MSLSPLSWASLGSAVFALLVATGPFVSAEPLRKELGQGLNYLRMASLPADLPSSGNAPQGALVVDIRGASSDRPGTKAFSAWLSFNGTGEYPIFVLANQDTSPDLKRSMKAVDCPALITLAPSGCDFTADIAVDTTQASDKDAYSALQNGEPLDGLLSMAQEKDRLDEAKLSRDYENGYRVQNRDTPPPAKADKQSEEPRKSRHSDLVLARAVQIHKALVVFRKHP